MSDRPRAKDALPDEPDDLEVEIGCTALRSDADHEATDELQSRLRVAGLHPIHLETVALRSVLSHGMANQSREVGGLLIGRVTDDGSRLVEILAAVPAKHNRESAARLTFTHDSWDQMLAEMERDYPGCRVVGWYHTHPRHGIFLSEHDLFIHRNFFSASHQVALVFDPTTGALGLFGWSAHQVVRYAGVPATAGARPETQGAAPRTDTTQTFGRVAVNVAESLLDTMADLGEGAKKELGAFFQELGSLLETAVQPIDRALENDGQANDEDGTGRHIDVRA